MISKFWWRSRLQEFFHFNQVLLAKLGWKLVQNPESLVSKIFKARYFPRGHCLNAKLGFFCPSYTRRSLWEARWIIEKGSRKSIASLYFIKVTTEVLKRIQPNMSLLISKKSVREKCNCSCAHDSPKERGGSNPLKTSEGTEEKKEADERKKEPRRNSIFERRAATGKRLKDKAYT